MILGILAVVAMLTAILATLAILFYLMMAADAKTFRPSKIMCYQHCPRSRHDSTSLTPCYCSDCAVCRRRDQARCKACTEQVAVILLYKDATLCRSHRAQAKRITHLETGSLKDTP
jgi:hypothetical protein